MAIDLWKHRFVTMSPERIPSETSPLLVPGNGTVTTGAIDIPREEWAEPRDGDEDQAKEPFPDAQAQLKWIIPAISLGVRPS